MIACTSESLDGRTQVITVLAEAATRDTDLEACISSAIAEGKSAIVVDLSALDEVEPTVLAALMRGHRRLGWRNGRLSLVGLTGHNGDGQRVLLNAAFDVCASRSEALMRVRGRPDETQPSPAVMYFGMRGGPLAPSRARRAIEIMAGGLESTLLGDIQLLTTELVSNCVKHGNAGPESAVQLGFSTPDGVVRVEVTDSGEGFELELPEADPHTPGRFGLLIVERVASRWGLSRGGRCVWFEVPRNA